MKLVWGETRRNPISRQLISRIISEKTETIFERVKTKLLDESKSVSLTFDLWSSTAGSKGFGVVTSHHIDDDFNARTILLDFRQVPYPHDADTIAEFIAETIDKFEIRNLILSVTTDNASSNIAALNNLTHRLQLEQNFVFGFHHLRCSAHIINLCVQQALKSIELDVLIVHNIVLTINSSRSRIERFEAIQQQLFIETNPSQSSEFKPLCLIENVKTRWNSTYLMIERFLRLKDALTIALSAMNELKSFTIDWDRLSAFMSFLKPFYESTLKISGERASVSYLSALMPKLTEHIAQDFSDELLNEAAIAFFCKFDDYASHLRRPLLQISTVLDPRFKLNPFDPSARDEICSNLRRFSQLSEDSQNDSTDSVKQSSLFDNLFDEKSKNELTDYLSATREPEKCDVLDYWRANKNSYPNLASLARKILAVQPTSVPSERAFSMAKELSQPRRCRLSDESFRSNMLLKSWLNYLE